MGIMEKGSAPAREAWSCLAFVFGDAGAGESGWTKTSLAAAVTRLPWL